jgi:hypothetical protein
MTAPEPINDAAAAAQLPGLMVELLSAGWEVPAVPWLDDEDDPAVTDDEDTEDDTADGPGVLDIRALDTTRGRMRVEHPLVGELNLDWDAYPMPGAPGPVLIVHTAEPGGPDHERLQLLTGLLDTPSRTATSARPDS